MESFIKSLEMPRDDTRVQQSHEPIKLEQVSGSDLAIDEELRAMLADQKTRIRVVGCGGGGNNTINRIGQVGIVGADTVAINTDAQDLLYTTAKTKILIGKEVTRGLGAGSNPTIGEQSARESEKQIRESLEGSALVFVTCGLGGGTGTGSAPIVAEIAKKLDILTVAIVTMPFSMEGNKRYENAVNGLERLEHIADTLIVIPNDKLLELAPDLPLHTAFKLADEILTNAVKGIAELITKEGLINLDFADIRAVMGGGGTALIGLGESNSADRAKEAVERAMNNPLIDADVNGATGALINVLGGTDMTLSEARTIVEAISSKMSDDARIIWGASIEPDLDRHIKVMLIVTGVKSLQLRGGVGSAKEKGLDPDTAKENFGIDFLE
jgi:cell division protein FtsZ